MSTRTRSRARKQGGDQAMVHVVMALLVAAVLSFEQVIMTASAAAEDDCPAFMVTDGVGCE